AFMIRLLTILSLFPYTTLFRSFAGILTGIPFKEYCKTYPQAQELWNQAGLDSAQFYYFGEVITCKQFRNKGIASANFKKLEDDRSEEHTSELQSRVDIVCRLLL